MRTTGGKGESASLLLGVRVGLFLHLGRENVGPPVNFGRFRGQIGRSGGASATGGALERGDGGRAPAQPDRWRPWRRPHWPLPAVSPAPSRGGKCQFRPRRKGGESASSDPAGKGGKVPVQTPPERGGKCHLWRWRRSAAAGDFEAVLFGSSAALRSSVRSRRRSWRPPGSIRPSGGCSDRG